MSTEIAVRLEGVTKRSGPVTALDGAGLRLRRGETVALLGPNGAGKSTTVGILLGLLRPDAGRVQVFGGSPHEATAAGRVGRPPAWTCRPAGRSGGACAGWPTPPSR